MKTIVLNARALLTASNALLGEKTNILSELYVLLDQAKTLGHNEGLLEGAGDVHSPAYNAGYEAGYPDGFEDGVADDSSQQYDAGFALGSSEGFEDGYDVGYAAARTALGECPMVEQDFDHEDEFVAMCQNRYVGDND